MLQRLRERAGSEKGFTLVELLVVMLILGILAAIAIPSFFNQRDKATDASAKSMARTSETAMETYATENGGVYNGTPAPSGTVLHDIEPTIVAADVAVTGVTADSYTVTATSGTDNTFSISRETDGTTTFDCTQADTTKPGGCPDDGQWGS
jgi:type IV pilus assembly protein PilA